MPDVHLGKGATVGSVIAMRNAVSPAAVGVDIGCGMAAQKTSLVAKDLPDSLGKLRAEIERAIPVGPEQHRAPAWEGEANLRARAQALLDRFAELDGGAERLATRASLQVGTLGGGNHFVELCLDTEGAVWLLLHSGSRHIGATLAEHHMQIAKRLFHNQELP